MSYVLGLDSTIKATERLNGTTASEVLQWDGSQWQHRGAAVGTPLYDTYVGGLEVVGAKDLIWNIDGGGDIGASGATRPDNVYVKTAVTIAGATAMKSGDSATGGDLSGTYPTSVQVVADSHTHTAASLTLALSALSDATITSPTDGAVLVYDTGTAKWRDAPMSADATITDLGVVTVQGIRGNNIYTGASSPSNRNVLFWDGPFSEWDVGYLASTDLSDTASIILTSSSIKDLNDVYSSMAPTDGQVLTYDTTNGWQAEAVPSGITTIAAATDTNITTPASGNILIWDGSDSWDNKAVSGDITLSSTGAAVVTAIQGDSVSASTPSNDQALVWTGSTYAPTDVCLGELTWKYAQHTVTAAEEKLGEVDITVAAVVLADIVALSAIIKPSMGVIKSYDNVNFYDGIMGLYFSDTTSIIIALGTYAAEDDVISVTYAYRPPDL